MTERAADRAAGRAWRAHPLLARGLLRRRTSDSSQVSVPHFLERAAGWRGLLGWKKAPPVTGRYWHGLDDGRVDAMGPRGPKPGWQRWIAGMKMRLAHIRRPRLPAGYRVYAIGDVHGRIDLLAELIDRISAEQSVLKPARTYLCLIGDLIDRGPRSARVLEVVRRLCEYTPKVVVLKGNHEQILIDAWRGDRRALSGWLTYGGVETLESFGVDRSAIDLDRLDDMHALVQRSIPADTIDWLDSLPLIWRFGDYVFVHAGIRPGLPLDAQEAGDVLWIRDEFIDFTGSHGAVIVHGHTISDSVELLPNRIGIDTGAYRSGILSGICLWGREQRVISTDPDALELETIAL